MSRITLMLLRHRAPITTLFNLTLATAAWVLAFALRFDLSVPERYVPVVVALLPVLLGCKLAGFAAFRLSKGWWRHVRSEERRVGKECGLRWSRYRLNE